MKSSSSPKSAPVLKQFANLWTMMGQPLGGKEWSMEEKFRRARAAGFEAMGGRATPEVAPLCRKYGMDYVCYTDAEGSNFPAKLKTVAATRPARVNVQLCDHDTLPKEAARVWIKMEALAEKMGLAADLEVHRDTCTETPEKTYEIAALYKKATGKKLRFAWDFSHLAVVKHLMPPYAERLLVRPDLICLSRQFHFRPFNGHHAQVPATDGKGRPTVEIKAYFDFVGALFDAWFAGAKGGEVVYGCPEFGPVMSGYGISTLPDVWKETLFVREKIAAMWKARQKAFLARSK
jgi:hypothetical protein